MQNRGEDKTRKSLMNEGTLKSKHTLFFIAGIMSTSLLNPWNYPNLFVIIDDYV